jgi:hypothetical protein
MPKSITFFSRGKTPIYVNYVIAHNTRGAPAHANHPVHKYLTYTYKLRTTSFKEKRALHDGKSLRATALF